MGGSCESDRGIELNDLLRQIRSYMESRGNILDRCFVVRCEAEGCSLAMDLPSSSFVLLDIDCYQQSNRRWHSKRCDFCFVGVDGGASFVLVAPIEMKLGQPRVSHVVQQLKASTQRLEQILPTRSQDGQALEIRFRPVVASGQGLRRGDIVKLKRRNNQVRFRGKNYSVLRIGCGSKISKVMSLASRD